MPSRIAPGFQSVAVSDSEGSEEPAATKHGKFWTPTATRPPLLVFILCFVLSLIVLLQVASSKSIGSSHLASEIHNVLAKRQTPILTHVYTGFQETITGTTITWQPSTYSGPSRTITYPLTVQMITGTTESEPGSTVYQYQTIGTNEDGQVFTEEYELSTSDGSVITIPLVGATPPAAYLDTSAPGNLAAAAPTTVDSSVATPTATGVTSSDLHFHGSSSTTRQANASATISQSPTTTASPVIALSEHDRVVAGHYSSARYYIAKYFPSIAVIVLKVLWSHVFASTKLVEPFKKLSNSRNGVNAASSLLADYLSTSISVPSLSNLLPNRYPLILIATLTAGSTLMLAPIASESMGIQGTAKCTSEDGTVRSCAPVWVLNMTCIRILQALLALSFVLIMSYTLLSLRSRCSGVYSDPSSIATVAGMSRNPEFVQELQSLPVTGSHREIRKKLASNRYALLTTPARGVPFNDVPSYEIVKTNNFQTTYLPQHSSPGVDPHSILLHHRSLLVHDVPLLLLTLLLLAFVLAYAVDYNSDGFNKFFNSNSFGPRVVLSSLATLLDNRFKRLEREVRILTPWRALRATTSVDTVGEKHFRGHPSVGGKLTTRGLPLTCYTSLPLALGRTQWFVAAVSATAVLGDVLIIAVVGVPYSDTEIYEAYRTSVWLSVSILGLMMLVGLVVTVFWRRGNRGIAQDRPMPDTVLEVARRVVEADLGGASRGGDWTALLPVEQDLDRGH